MSWSAKTFQFTPHQRCVSYLQLFVLCGDLVKVLTKFLQLTVAVLSQLFVLLKLCIHFLKLERWRKRVKWEQRIFKSFPFLSFRHHWSLFWQNPTRPLVNTIPTWHTTLTPGKKTCPEWVRLYLPGINSDCAAIETAPCSIYLVTFRVHLQRRQRFFSERPQDFSLVSKVLSKESVPKNYCPSPWFLSRPWKWF